jgi:flagellar basal-body rod protein FlgB
MIKTGLYDQDHLAILKKAVDVYARRHQVTARNISNIETPGYRAQRVKFEDLLSHEQMRLQGYRTHRSHLPLGAQDVGSTREEIVAMDSDYDNGVNNVDIDDQMTTLATNDLSYRMATRLLSMRYSVLRGAIKGQIR